MGELKRDRQAKMPGGMECCHCGSIFIGDEWHELCAVCYDATLKQDTAMLNLAAAQERNRELTRQVEQLQEDKAYLSDAMQSAINLIVALKEQRARMHLEDALGARGNLAPMQAMRRANDLVERWRKPQYYGMVSQLYKDGCDDTFRNCAALLEYALTAPPSSSDPGRADTGREET